jgi:hypothetical protein
MRVITSNAKINPDDMSRFTIAVDSRNKCFIVINLKTSSG